MKLSLPTILPALCWSASLASAASASFYTYDPHSRSHAQSRTLSPVAARLVLAQRAGVEEYHSADLDREEVIDAINDFGVRTSLFEEETHKRSTFIYLDGVKDTTESIAALKDHASFTVDPVPESASSRELYMDIARQLGSNDWKLSEYESNSSDTEGKIFQSGNHEYHFYHAGSIKELERLFHTYDGMRSSSITVMIMPLNTSTTPGSWGTYEMPDAESPLSKRQQKEEPLEMEPMDKQAPAKSDSTPFTTKANKTGEPLRGILPACFSTLSACEKETRNCTGHGRCTLYHSDKSRDPKSSAKDCYSCQCKATIHTDDEGRVKTTNWGGPACQKKDISNQFWLIALFSVAMMFLVSFGIGTIWTMGDEELPSVIGAGVSGPVKRS